MRGLVKFTITFNMEVDSADWVDDFDEKDEEAKDIETLAIKMKQMYDDGTAEIVEDLANADDVKVVIEPV
jgi:hypothetical protein